jgi:hypothetical protein
VSNTYSPHWWKENACPTDVTGWWKYAKCLYIRGIVGGFFLGIGVALIVILVVAR